MRDSLPRVLRAWPVLLCMLAPFANAGTLTFELNSSYNNQVVQPGDVVDWQIEFTVSDSDNYGAAAILTDFVQGSNPASIFMTPASEVPPAMQNFSLPNGISNFVSVGTGSGFGGTSSGTDTGCDADLKQIGGAQNTLGIEMRDMGLNVVPDLGIGQGGGSWLLAEGVFTLPNTPGIYEFTLENRAGLVISAVESEGAKYRVEAPTIAPTSAPVIRVVMCQGDVNGSGGVDSSDLALVLQALGTEVGDPGFDAAADLNRDDVVDSSDLAIVLGSFGTDCCGGPCPWE